MNETWADIEGYEGFYKISTLGRVKSMPRNGTIKQERILKPHIVRGYAQAELRYKGVYKSHKVHRLVAEAFIPNPDKKPEVNHINGIKTDNCLENLEWATSSENQLHSAYILGNHLVPVIQYSKEGKFIREWRSTKEAGATLGIDGPSITNTCKNRRKTAGGYIWKYNQRKEVNAYRIL